MTTHARNSYEQCVEGSIVPDVTVFDMAWLIEKDLSEIVREDSRTTQGKAEQALIMLSNWARSTERFFREYSDKLSDVYANMPWGG